MIEETTGQGGLYEQGQRSNGTTRRRLTIRCVIYRRLGWVAEATVTLLLRMPAFVHLILAPR
jgi:hypothetical protein